MSELFWQFDSYLFLAINHLPHNFFFDSFFVLLTGVGFLGIIWFFLLALLFFWKEVKVRKGFFALIIALVSNQLLVELIFKNLLGRLRPQFVIPSTIVVIDLVHSFSFPSAHATMAFAGAYILAKEYRQWTPFYYLLAFLIAFSRIYLGKHYPSDVVVGAFLGLGIGWFSTILINKPSKF